VSYSATATNGTTAPTRADVETIRVTPDDLPDYIAYAWAAGRIPIVHGKPGSGKSQIAQQCADVCGLPLRSYRAAQMDPTTIGGMMVPDMAAKLMLHFPDQSWPTTPVVMHFDELNRASVFVQNAVFELFDNRRIGDQALPDGTLMIVSVNGEQDGGGVVRMPQALNNRFIHYYLETSASQWTRWACDHGIHPIVIAYITNNPDDLHRYSPVEDCFPTPRTWEFVSDVLNKTPDLPVRHSLAVFCGTVGHKTGVDFQAFWSSFADLPDLGSIRLNPDTAPLPTTASAKWVTANAIANTMDDRTAGTYLRYLERIGQESVVFAIKMAERRVPALGTNGDVTRLKTRLQNAF
jgi:hypothetical protein